MLARILCSLLTKSAMYCLLTVLEEPAEEATTSALLMNYPTHTMTLVSQKYLEHSCEGPSQFGCIKASRVHVTTGHLADRQMLLQDPAGCLTRAWLLKLLASTGMKRADGEGGTKAQDEAGQDKEPQGPRLVGQDVQGVAQEACQRPCQDGHLEAVLGPDAVACSVQKHRCAFSM